MSGFLERAKELRALKTPHINCAQAVAVPFAEAKGIPAELTLRFAAGFGGGMKRGSVCGAVTGGIMALGLYGLDDPKTLGAFHQKLTEKYRGMLDCGALVRAAADAGLEKKPFCDCLIYESIAAVDELLKEQGLL